MSETTDDAATAAETPDAEPVPAPDAAAADRAMQIDSEMQYSWRP